MQDIVKDKNLLIVFGITLMVVMGVSSIMPVLPMLAKELNAPIESIGLILTSFTLPGIFLTPVAGIIADRYGRKIVLIPSLLIFGLAGAACGFAHDLTTLIMLRFIQGIGAAPLGLLYNTIIGDLYKGKERTRIMGINAGVLSLGTAIFPFFGGLLGEAGWDWPFFLPIIALPLCYASWRYLDIPRPEGNGNMKEYFKKAAEHAKTGQAIALFAVTMLTFCILYGPLVTFLPVLGDTRFNMPPSAIGSLLGISSLATAITSSQIGRLNNWFRERTMLMTGHILYFIAMVGIPFADHFWWLLWPIFAFGLAQGFNFPNLITLLTSLAPLEQRAAIMAINGTILRLAQTVAPMLFTLAFWLGGLDWAFYLGGVCAAGMFVITLMYITGEKRY